MDVVSHLAGPSREDRIGDAGGARAGRRGGEPPRLAEQVHPDVVLIDTGLDPHGHLTKLLISGDPALLVIVLIREVHRTPGFLNGALSLGAHAVVPRSVEPRRLIEAIRRAYLDRRYV